MLFYMHLQLYQIPTLHDKWVDYVLKHRYGGWNHLAVSIQDDMVYHVTDNVPPNLMKFRKDRRLLKPVERLYLGVFEYDGNPYEIAMNLKKTTPRWWEGNRGRYLYYHSLGLWPKRNDCVHLVTKLVNKFNKDFPILYNDIPEVYNTYKEIAKSRTLVAE